VSKGNRKGKLRLNKSNRKRKNMSITDGAEKGREFALIFRIEHWRKGLRGKGEVEI